MPRPARTLLPLLALLAIASCDSDDSPNQPTPTPVEPPFWGTIFISPDILTDDDPTTFEGLTYVGQGSRSMYDRRLADFVTVEAFLFDATFDDGLAAEVQVNPEFEDHEVAQVEAEKYAEAIGRLPTVLREDVETVWIHQGDQLFGGGNNNILIHTEQGEQYIEDGILHETLLHEAVHTSLDAAHANHPTWRAAQEADPTFISDYAEEFPLREDLAESFVPWFAVRYRADRIPQSLYDTIVETIPNRIEYFNSRGFDMYPVD
ncbi:MAG: hypothetical protein WD960_02065 [Gemmatimonadota bacterium]